MLIVELCMLSTLDPLASDLHEFVSLQNRVALLERVEWELLNVNEYSLCQTVTNCRRIRFIFFGMAYASILFSVS